MTTKTKTTAKTDWYAVHAEAERAGQAAAEAVYVAPMIVEDRRARKAWYVEGGVCGFAWVEFKGNTAWGRWAKAHGLTYPGYPTGLRLRISGYGQSLARKEAHARAYAEVLRAHGVQAWPGSMID